MYFSADYSSVTFDVGNNFADQTISVRMGACNSTQIPMTLTLRAAPGQPTLPSGISFSQGMCLPLGAPQQTIALGNTDPNSTYVWGNLAGWLTDPTVATDTVTSANNHTLTFTPQDDARVLWLKVINSCGIAQTYNLSVNRTLSNNNKIQTVSGSTCVEPNTYVPFMVTGVENSVKITWEIVDGVSNGWKIYPGAENSAQPFIFTGTGNATINVTNSCGHTIQETFSVKPKVPIINSGSPVCVTDGVLKTFSVRNPDPAATYQWSYPSTWAPAGAVNQSSIKLTPDNTGGWIKVRVTYPNSCSSDWSDSIQAAQFSLAMLKSCINAGSPDVVQVQVSGYSDIKDVTIDDITFGTIDTTDVHSTGIFKINTTGKEGTFKVTVSASDICGDDKSIDLQYTIQKENFTVTETVIAGIICVFEVKELYSGWFADQSITWTVNNVTPYPTALNTPHVTDFIFLSAIPQKDSIVSVTVIDNTTGCSTTKYKMLNGTPQFRAKSVNEFETVYIADVQSTEGELTLYPNPTNAELTINMSSEENINFNIISMSGSIVKEGINQLSKTTIDVSDLTNGTYIISVLQGTNRYTKQFIKK